MWYLIYAEDIPNSNEVRAKARPAHIARLKELIAQDRLLCPHPHEREQKEDDKYDPKSVFLEKVGFHYILLSLSGVRF